jgi:hypothetical protein
MALTLPDPEELDQFTQGASDIFSDDAKFVAFQQAADLFYVAAGITDDPTDEYALRILKWGLMDMAYKILITRENQAEIYSPYSSETIGSYTYSKMLSAIQAGLRTGVEWFDIALSLLTGAANTGAMSVSSEHVFTEPYCEPSLAEQYQRQRPDVYGW